MKLQEIFDHLGHGELSQLAVRGDDSPFSENAGIENTHRLKILAHIELALGALFRRFRLRDRQVLMRLVPGRTSYVLHSDFRVENGASSESVRYLVDTPLEPFDDTILKIDDVRAVLEKNAGLLYLGRRPSLALNVPGDPFSIRTPQPTSLVLPDALVQRLGDNHATSLEVHYRSAHPKLDPHLALSVPYEVEVALPSTHLEALLYFVASRMMNPVGMTDEFHAGNSYYAKFEAECQRLEALNYQIDDIGDEERFHSRGFV